MTDTRVLLLGEFGTEELVARTLLATSKHEDGPFGVLEHFTRDYVARLLLETGGNVSEAARRAGPSRVHWGHLVAKYRLK